MLVELKSRHSLDVAVNSEVRQKKLHVGFRKSMGVFMLTIVRHGETQENNERVIQGQLDTELSDKGILQAQLAGIRLQQENFTHVYSSDLRRAYKTCEIILEKNTVSNCTVVKDPRLRERKSGTFEGRTSEDFRAAARLHSLSGAYADDFPPGGETNKQFLARGREFFQDLCRKLLEELENDSESELLKRRKNAGSLSSDVFPTSDSTGVDGLTFSSMENKLSPTTTRDSGHSSSGSTSSTSGCESLTTGSSLEQLSEQTPLSEHVAPSENTTLLEPTQLNLTTCDQADLEPTSDISPSQESSCSSVDDNFTEPVLCLAYDSDIQNVIPAPRTIQYGCPNVSLSPIFEHRLSSLSSVSSGRNNSFDDGDSLPLSLAEVLVVSHGGLIQKLITYFVENLGCVIPGGKKHTIQISPNTGLSKFTVALEPGMEQPTVTCLFIHDKDHLISQEVAPLVHGGEI